MNKTLEAAAEKEIDEVTKTLNVVLPNGNMSVASKAIALLTSLGGISILGNILADIVRPGTTNLFYYFLRIIVGLVMVIVGYGIIKKKGWVVWLYGGISCIGLIINPVLALVPLCITAYLYHQKKYFDLQLPRKILNGTYWKKEK